jgi:hypothetical protein
LKQSLETTTINVSNLTAGQAAVNAATAAAMPTSSLAVDQGITSSSEFDMNPRFFSSLFNSSGDLNMDMLANNELFASFNEFTGNGTRFMS